MTIRFSDLCAHLAVTHLRCGVVDSEERDGCKSGQTINPNPQGKFWWYGVLDSGLGPRLVTGTAKTNNLL